MTAQTLLSRRPHRATPALALGGDMTLARGGVHEICGSARRTLALQVAAAAAGPVVWIAPNWGTAPLNPCGMSDLLCPGQVVFVQAPREVDLLWTMEEALKSGAAPVVVADMESAPGMTPVRRLHLAAEASVGTGTSALGLILTPGSGGAQGIETRWSCDPAHAPGADGWRLARMRARMLPPKVWRWTGRTTLAWTEECRVNSAQRGTLTPD